MNVQKEKTQTELTITVELSWDDMKTYLDKAAAKISEDVKVEGFRPGKAPYDMIKNKVGEMTVLQEAANIAIQKTADGILKTQLAGGEENVIGRPEVKLTKVAADNPLEYKVVLALAPEVTLGKYKDLGIIEPEIKVETQHVASVLKDLREMRASETLVERDVKDGDKVVVDIQMFLDNVPIDGGQSKNTSVMIGADYIIPGFDKQLLGAKQGETKEFKLPYPKDHYQRNLAGKMVDFKVSVQGVYERNLPELNDDFAKNLGAKDVSDLKQKISDNMEQDARQKNEQKLVIDMFEKILAKTKFSHLPEQLVHSETHVMLHELKENVEKQGGKFADYLTHLKKTEEELETELKPEAAKRVKTSFIVSQIVKDEGIAVSDEEVKQKIDDTLKVYENNPEFSAQGGPVADWQKQADTAEYRHYVRSNLLNQKVIAKLKEWNVKS